MKSNNRFDLEHHLIRKALRDEDFRRLLLDDPRATLAQALDGALPDGVNAKVLVEDQTHMHVVIPNPAHDYLGKLEVSERLRGHGDKGGRKPMEAQVICQLLQDPALRQQFLADPGALVRRQVALPEAVEVTAIEEPADTVLISFPYLGRKTLRDEAQAGAVSDDPAPTE